MFASDYSSDDEMSVAAPQPKSEISRSGKSKSDSNNLGGMDSPLKRAIKENENSIIQSILSPPSLSSRVAVSTKNGGDKSSKLNSANEKNTSVNATDGLSPLLDCLFEDGQLTRIEYDIVDKGYGINSATEQVQVLLRILLESKDDEALEILLECLSGLDPTSDIIRKLCGNFLPSEENNNVKNLVFHTNIKREEAASQPFHSSARGLPELIFLLHRGDDSNKRQDFYYGRNQGYNCSRKSENVNLNGEPNAHVMKIPSQNEGKRNAQPNASKPNIPLASVDFKDFFLTNGCLETIRNLLLDNCIECTTPLGWEKVLRSMNGLLSTDVLSIKDLLFQMKRLREQREQEEEARLENLVKTLHRERINLRGPNAQEERQQQELNKDCESKGIDDERKSLRRYENQEDKTDNENVDKQGSDINWNQVIYHSFHVWKQRNGSNSTFYSLIGIFQHSNLYQTADLLLERKAEIQSRENEADIAEGDSIDVNNKTVSLTKSTMLEKSEFLRKFYTPSRRNDNDGSSKSVGLSTTKDRVTASPVLSLDLL